MSDRPSGAYAAPGPADASPSCCQPATKPSQLARPGRAVARALCIAFVALAPLASAQPFPTFVLDTSRVVGPDYARSSATACAMGDGVGLVVWVDNGPRLKGARVDCALELTDSVCFDIAGAQSSGPMSPRTSVAWSGQNFLVVWDEGWIPAHLKAALVAPSGQVLRRLVVDSTQYYHNCLSVAFDGSNYVLTWDDQAFLYYTRVNPAGTVVDPRPRRASTRPGTLSKVVRGTGGCLVAFWRPDFGVWGNVVLPDGSLLDTLGFPIQGCSEVGYLTATAASDRFLVFWQNPRGQLHTLLAATVDVNGRVIDSLCVGRWDAVTQLTAATLADTTLLVWHMETTGRNRLFARRYDVELGSPDSAPFPLTDSFEIAMSPTGPSVMGKGDTFLAVWSHHIPPDSGFETYDVVAQRLRANGEYLDSNFAVFSRSASAQSVGDVASTGGSFLAVWQDYSAEAGHVQPRATAMPFDREGRALCAQPIRLPGSCGGPPVVGAASGRYLVCWPGLDLQMYGVRLDSQGALLDSTPFPVARQVRCSDGTGDLAASCSDTVFVLAYQGFGPRQVYAVPITFGGVALDAYALASRPGTWDVPHLAAAPSGFLAVWTHECEELWAADILPSGVPADTARKLDVEVGGAGYAGAWVARGDSAYMVHHAESRAMWRVLRGGVVLGTTMVNVYGRDHYDLLFDGTNFMATYLSPDLRCVSAIRVAPDGQLLDPTPFALAAWDTTQSIPGRATAAAMDSAGHVAVVFESWEPEPYMSMRVRGAVFPWALPGISGAATPPNAPLARLRPVPAKGGVVMRIDVSAPWAGAIELLDVAGRRVAVPWQGHLQAGRVDLSLDLRAVPTGLYFLRARGLVPSARLVVSR